MTNIYISKLAAALVLIATTISSGHAKAEGCPEVPKVAGWGDTTAEGLTAVVDHKYDGDWAPFIKNWENHEKQMRAAIGSGKVVTLKSHEQALQGDELADYIELVGQRVVATRCIADVVIDTRLMEEFNNMETAAGGNPEMEIYLVE